MTVKISTLCLCTFLLIGCSSERYADIILYNGKIYTVDGRMSEAQAVAVSSGRFLAVGNDAQVRSVAGPDTRFLNLEGRTVFPGFIDSHYHFIGVGRREYYLNLDGTRSMRDFLSRVKTEVDSKGGGEWIVGRGWIEEDWPSKRFPTCQDLDKIAPDNPVILTRADGHAVVVNSKALMMAGIDRHTADPQGGEILKDAQGNCNGLLLDKAIGLVTQHVPSDTSTEMTRRYARKADELALAYGMTQVHDTGTNFRTVDVYKEMYAENDLKIRIRAYIRGPGKDTDLLLEQGPEIGLFNDKLSVRGIKITQDGALGSRGAALLQPYSDAETSGFLIFKDEQVYPTIKKALENGVQMAIHAIGDSTNRNVLNLFERAFAEVPASRRVDQDPRFRIEHAQIVHPDDRPRFRQLGVIPSMQPSHAIGDLHFAGRRLGMDRMQEGYAWRAFIDQGNYIPAGSDAPVEEGNPMIEFYAAVVRKDTTGFNGEGWFPQYRMTREEALQALTIWGARAAFSEDLTGSIEVGKYADLVVLDRDLMTAPEDRLFDTEVLLTMVGGEVVHESSDLRDSF